MRKNIERRRRIDVSSVAGALLNRRTVAARPPYITTLYRHFLWLRQKLRTLALVHTVLVLRGAPPGDAAHLSLTGGGMLNAGNSFALGLSNSIAIVFYFTARASCTVNTRGDRPYTAGSAPLPPRALRPARPAAPRAP